MANLLTLLGGGKAQSIVPPLPTTGLTARYRAGSLSANDGDNIVTWTDSSGNSRDWAGTGTYKVAPTGFNGKNAIDFNGTTNTYTRTDSSTFEVISSTAWTMYAVFRADAINGTSSDPWSNDTLAEVGIRSGLHLRNTPVIQAWGYDGGTKTTTQAVATGTTYIAVAHFNGSSIYLSVNNGSESSIACGTIQAGNPTHYTSDVFFDGRIAEIGFYNVNLSAGDLSNLYSALNAEYAAY